MTIQKKTEEVIAFLSEMPITPSKCLIAYSGGKDSIVVAHLLSKYIGVKDAVADCSWWFDRHRADSERIANKMGLNVTYVDRFGDDYLLNKHPDWLFPPKNVYSSIYSARQHKTCESHSVKNNYKAVFFGRRTQENTVPKRAYMKRGILQVHPIRDWKESDIWEYLEVNNIEVPSIYKSEMGPHEGSTSWNLIHKELYDRPVADVIRDFCPSTYERLRYKGII
jgi:3'-phosphoadenosine 5'-phosphosulfate sulfotransferase (PAPS reductase)/FAD synthetase